MGPQSGRDALAEMAAALRLEAHMVQQRPRLLWQQLHNWLQWSDGPASGLVVAETARRLTGPIWFSERTPPREGRGLLGTIRPVGGISACAVAPDGSRLCTAARDGGLQLWGTRTGQETGSTIGAGDPVVSCAFDQTGALLITGSCGGAVTIRDGRSLAPLASLETEDAAAHCAVSPVAPWAAVASGGVLRLIELPSGRVTSTAPAEQGEFTCCTVSADGDLIVTGDDAGTMAFWATAPLVRVERAAAHDGPVRGCAVAPNLAFVATAGADEIKVWSPVDTGGLGSVVLKQFAAVNDCAISPDGRTLVSVSDDRTIWLRDLGVGEGPAAEVLSAPVSVLEGHDGTVRRCEFAANASLMATTGGDGTVKLWDPRPETGSGYARDHEAGTAIRAVCYAPSGAFVVSAGKDLTLKVWTPAPTAERATLEGCDTPVSDCAVLDGDETIVSGEDGGTIRLWNTGSGDELAVMNEDFGFKATALAVSPREPRAAVASERSATLWDLGARRREKEATLPSEIQGCAFSPDAARVLWACEDGAIRVWDVTGWSEVAVLRGHAGPAWSCAVGPDGTFAVSAGGDGTIRLWDLGTATEAHSFAGHEGTVWDCAITADGASIISVGQDQMLRIWDVRSRAMVAELHGPDPIRSVAAHPSGSQLTFGDTRGRLRVVDVIGRGFEPPPAVETPSADEKPPAQVHDRPVGQDDVLTATKRCMNCGQRVELLRFRCPHCASGQFDAPGPVLADRMMARQLRSQRHVDQGGRLFQQGRYDEAVAEFQKAIEANPFNATAHGNIGVVFLRRQEPREALRWFERALEFDPEVPGAKEMVAEAKRMLE